MKTPTFFILICLFFYATQESFAQTEAAKPIIWNPYQHEVGLDFKGLFRYQSGLTGTTILYKRRMKNKVDSTVLENKALRFQVSGYADVPIGLDTFYNAGSNSSLASNYNRRDISMTILVGTEWQQQLKRFQLFYGYDTGISFYNFKRTEYGSFTSSLTSYSVIKSQKFGIPIRGFFGVKYFFHPRISVSIESGAEMNINFLKDNKALYFVDGSIPVDTTYEGKRNELTFNFQYLRNINLSYYF